LLVLWFVPLVEVRGADEGVEFFEKKIRPLLVEHCYKCHGAQSGKVKGGLLLDTREGLLKGGDTGPAIVPGKSEESLLIKAVVGSDESLPRMPYQKPPLDDKQIALLKTWINQGAKAPADERLEGVTTGKTKHWAFQSITRPVEPAVRNLAWVRNPIDRFILARLEKEKIAPSSEADRVTLIRRLFLDLLGLTPSIAEVDEFMSDTRPDAYEHLVDRLLAEGHRVIAIDNLITGNSGNIGHLAGEENFRFIKHNVSNFIFLPEEKLDYVFHFASPASPIDYLELPIPTLKVGALGTHNTLGLAKDKEASFILASTSEVYGDPLEHPQKEDYWGNVNPIGPRGVYDEAKRFAEAITMAYHRYHRLDTKIVRIFNTYGPRMRLRDGRAVPAFIGQALSGEPLTVFGDGSQTRSFCYVSDLIDGIFKLAMSSFHEPVNLGNPREMTITQFAEEIIRITGTKSTIEYKPLPVDDPKVRQPDISRAKEVLSWEPRVGFEEGIKKTIEYFRDSLKH